MKSIKFGLQMAAREHMLQGRPITRLEAITLFGMQNLMSLINIMRKNGWIINSRQVPYAFVVKRINEFATFVPPPNFPVKEIQVTEYWISK